MMTQKNKHTALRTAIRRGIFSFALLLCAASAIPNKALACTSPTGTPGDIIFNSASDAFQGCTTKGWRAFTSMIDPCAGSPAPGTACANGSIYAGLSPDGNVPMYMMAANGPAGTYAWGPSVDAATVANCTGAYTGLTCRSGKANSAALAALGASYAMATYCENLAPPDAQAHGRSDWYLPSKDEYQVLFSLGAQPANGFTNAAYYSSSENSSTATLSVNMNSGALALSNKSFAGPVRCVRR